MPTQTPTWTLADRLVKARKWAHISTSQIASRLGVSRQTIGNWESGRIEPSGPAVVAWAAVTEVPAWWLRGEDPPADLGDRATLWTRDLLYAR